MKIPAAAIATAIAGGILLGLHARISRVSREIWRSWSVAPQQRSYLASFPVPRIS